MIKIGQIGFGKTGRLVAEEILNSTDCELLWVIRKTEKDIGEPVDNFFGTHGNSAKIFGRDALQHALFWEKNSVDLIVDFSHATGIYEYGSQAASLGIGIISAISQYEAEQIHFLRSLSQKIAVMHSPNITVGINLLMEVSRLLRKIIPHADIEIIEQHFRDKPEVSGTARKIAQALDIDDNAIHSIRAGGIVGRHEVIFGLPNQTLRMIHDSIHRRAFGQGALFAARWLIHKEPGFYTMEESLREALRLHIEEAVH